MNMKKMVSCLVAGSMLTMAVSAFAQIPETQVSTINNAAVVAFDGVNAHQSMNIEGDVYAGGQVKFDNAGENYLDGDIKTNILQSLKTQTEKVWIRLKKICQSILMHIIPILILQMIL